MGRSTRGRGKLGTVQTKGSWEVIPKERDVLVSLHYRASETSTKTADNALGSTSPVNKCLPSQNIPHTLAGPAANMNSFKVGQFHAKKTRFEVTTSKTSFLGPNLLVRPHVVH